MSLPPLESLRRAQSAILSSTLSSSDAVAVAYWISEQIQAEYRDLIARLER